MVSLQFENFAKHTVDTVRNLFNDPSHCDVTLACGSEGRINAHKFLLAGASPVFKNILSEFPMSPQFIFLRGFQFEDLAALIKFIYLGKLIKLICWKFLHFLHNFKR
jgi:hypothetical protein